MEKMILGKKVKIEDVIRVARGYAQIEFSDEYYARVNKCRSYVAGADAMCATLAGLSTSGIFPDSPEPPAILKILWGAILGVIA